MTLYILAIAVGYCCGEMTCGRTIPNGLVMKNVFAFSVSLILCVLTASNACTVEQNTKPTREQIIEFLEDYRNNHPLTEAEKRVGWDKREKVDLVKQFGTDFAGLDLSGLDFRIEARRVVASGADFSYCNMQETAFDGAELVQCKFTHTDLSHAMLRCCELKNADFSNARLSETEFLYSNMQNTLFADLDASTCEFYGIDFAEARLMKTNFSQAVFDMGSDFQRADLSDANMTNTTFHLYSHFQDANLNNVNFTNAYLALADFSGANLEGADFTGANLYAALFIDVRGIDDAQRKALERRSARWFYDFVQNSYKISRLWFYPGCLLTLIFAVICSITGIRSKEKKTRSFMIAFLLNGFAVFSTFCTFLMLFSGGHPVRQMSGGNYNAWSTWLHFFPIPMLGLMICIVCSVVLIFIVLIRLILNRNNVQPWRLFFYQVLTLTHCLFAFNWLIMFMPDA